MDGERLSPGLPCRGLNRAEPGRGSRAGRNVFQNGLDVRPVDWQALDQKLRSSIIEGLSVFLSVFDLADVARFLSAGPSGPAALARRGAR